MIFIHLSILRQILYGFALGLVVAKVANLATTVYLHRYLTHAAFEMPRWLQLGFRFVLWISTGLIPAVWAGVHQQHHAHVDQPGVGGDPHSPVVLGTTAVLFKNAYYYRKASKWDIVKHRADTIWRNRNGGYDRFDRWFAKPYLGLSIGIGFSIIVFGPIAGLVLSVVHMVWYLFLSGVINSLGHYFGFRPNSNGGSATNIPFPVACGEGWHNNHHAQPNSAWLGWHWWQIDLGRYLIWGLEKTNLAWKVRRPRSP